MLELKQTIKKYSILRAPYTILSMVKALIVLWLPLIFKNPSLIRFIPQWIISFRPGATPFKEGVAWVPFEALKWLDSHLNKEMNAFEWGSGGSTFFIAKRVKKIVSVEHDPRWYFLFSNLMKKKNISNCKYLLKKGEISSKLGDSSSFQNYRSGNKDHDNFTFKEYCRAIDSSPDNHFDFIFIDGRARLSCIARAVNKIKPGGYLMLDDSERNRYSKARLLLKDWTCKEFFGPKPYMISLSYTTVWQRKIR